MATATKQDIESAARFIADQDWLDRIDDNSITVDVEREINELDRELLDDDDLHAALTAEIRKQVRARVEDDARARAYKSALAVARKLNLFGDETAQELMANHSRIDALMEPECEHGSQDECDEADCCTTFPAWFVERAEEEADEFRTAARVLRNIDRLAIDVEY